VKLVHLVGFITKKFFTMHGNMNVKKYIYFITCGVVCKWHHASRVWEAETFVMMCDEGGSRIW